MMVLGQDSLRPVTGQNLMLQVQAIPAMYVFSGREGLPSGRYLGLMAISFSRQLSHLSGHLMVGTFPVFCKV